MAGGRVSVVNSRIKGLQTEFSGLFQNRLKGSLERKMLSKVMGFIGSKNNARTETFHYFGDGGGFRRWDQGKPRTYTELTDVSFAVEILKWEDGIQWERIDEEDDLTGQFRGALGGIANKAILIEIEAFFQVLQGASDPDRLKASQIPTASDGLAWFSSSRSTFGTGGNIVAGSGVKSVKQIKRDIFRVRKRINGLVDAHGDLYHKENVFMSGMVILFNDANLERFAEAFGTKMIEGVNGPIENVLMSESWAGPITLWPTPRITDDSWYVVALGHPEPAFFALERRDLGSEPEQLYKDENNDTYCSENDVRRMLYRKRVGFGLSLPQAWCQVTNS